MTTIDLTALALDRLAAYLKRPVTPADLDRRYDELGVDSVDMVSLAFEVEEALGQPVSPEIFLEFESIREALAAIASGRGNEIG
ncbi:acyl carrier protein [uncultured Tateyamaria sp.]|uniref:acyl carrier protein n=1 Tax=uncultured Tateyamaria sp. TaxID=455651 RepID=UPI002617703E|nr:acyl carrier protein [uncultured Tateyamaria sp.]